MRISTNRQAMRAKSMDWFLLIFILLFQPTIFSKATSEKVFVNARSNSRNVIDVHGASDSLVWVVQLSDLHFSVYHPERARDFQRLIAPILAMINPSLVLLTGDLVDAKSSDLLTMKQDEEEWIEYNKVMEDVIKRSGLRKDVFYDLRGNHDTFGVPSVGSEFDFFQKYSINGVLRRNGHVHSVTLQTSGWKYLFVGFDCTMTVGIRGPTNLFGHPTDHLLADLGAELSQWDSQERPVIKIAFGHFPLSFSSLSQSGKGLKDIFLEHSLSAYLCGHLHAKFGRNLKRHHISGHSSGEYVQLNVHTAYVRNNEHGSNCSSDVSPVKEFWEWEMGDWRKSRALRILAIDAGHISYVDLDLSSRDNNIIILLTFPIDSRFMQRISSQRRYKCKLENMQSYHRIRTLVFSDSDITSVAVKIYDSRPDMPETVFESQMEPHKGNHSRSFLYTIPWNWRAFEDPSPERFWIQIEVIDMSGKATFSELRPFSINGVIAKVDWRWKEFFVMGCQWASLYSPLLWLIFLLLLSSLIIPKILSVKPYLRRDFHLNFDIGRIWRCCLHDLCWISLELSKITSVWFPASAYLVYLMFFPWFCGQIFTKRGTIGCMTHRGWILNYYPGFIDSGYIGHPDVMVIVLPHLILVLFPTVLILGAMAAERMAFRTYYLSLSGKKNDDETFFRDERLKLISVMHPKSYSKICSPCCYFRGRWIRKCLLVICAAILWMHWMQCRLLVKAFEMNLFIHSPVYCLTVPLLLAYSVYKTSGA